MPCSPRSAKVALVVHLHRFLVHLHRRLWQAASITPRRSNMMVRGLIERQAATRYALTEQGRAVLAALLVGDDHRSAPAA
jgi:hypothetical protein